MSTSIICYKEIEWDGHEVAELLKRSSLKQCLEFLTNGYIKKHATQLQHSMYPFVLQQMSIKYLGGERFFIRFKSLFTDKERMELINEHFARIPESSPLAGPYDPVYVGSTILIDFPISVNDDTINIKINLKINGKGLPNGVHFIGIVPDTFKRFDKSIYGIPSNKRQDISGDFGIRCWGALENGKEASTKGGDFNDGDIICMEYKGKSKQLKLTRHTTKELLITLNVEPKGHFNHWYPAISLRDRNDSIEIV